MKLRLLTVAALVIGLGLSFTAAADNNSKDMKEARMQTFKAGKEGRTINYGPKNAKSVVWIFTDLNCPACQEMHHEVKKLNELGVQVRFMAFPRRGINSSGYTKLVSIWCAQDPAAALEKGMSGRSVPSSETCENPVKTQFMLGHSWDILGTPTIVFADGTQMSGYYPAEKIAREAEKHSNKGE